MLNYQYFKDHYNLFTVDITKRKQLDPDSRAIQQIKFYGVLKTMYSFRKIKRNDARILQTNSKSYVNNING